MTVRPRAVELGDALLGGRDGDALLEHQRAVADAELLAGRADGGHAEAGVIDGVAHAVRANAAGARGADDGRRDGVLLGALRSGGEGEHLGRIELAVGRLHLRQLGLAEQEGAARAEHGDADAAGAVPRVGALVDDAAPEAEEDAAGDVRGGDGGDDGRAQRGVYGEGRHRHLDGVPAGEDGRHGADEGGDHGPPLREQARGEGDGREHVGAPARVEEHAREGAVEAGPRADAAELAPDDPGAGDHRVALAASRRRGGAGPWEHLDLAARDRHVDGHHLARLDEDRLAGLEVEHLDLAHLPVLVVAAPGGGERGGDEGALRRHLPARALGEPGAHGRGRHEDARERGRLRAEGAIAPERRPHRRGQRPGRGDERGGGARVGRVARGGGGPAEEHARADAGEDDARGDHEARVARERERHGEAARDHGHHQEQRADVAGLRGVEARAPR